MQARESNAGRRVLVLGAGRVAGPLVRDLAGRSGLSLTVADLERSKAQALVAEGAGAQAVALDARDDGALGQLVASHDLVVSLLPASEHTRVGRHALDAGRHLVTTSYIGAEMRALDAQARAKGLTFLNECGLDPGIDHMTAARMIRRARDAGERVLSFRSYCGGLPAPEADTNPVRYKFSWAPRGALLAATEPARYLEEGRIVEVAGEALLGRGAIVEVPGAGRFEAYPNRDSLAYAGPYGLGEARTLIRGTLRHPGHGEVWHPWVRLGLLDRRRRDDLDGMTRAGFLRSFLPAGGEDLAAALAARLGLAPNAPTIRALEWLGFLEESPLPLREGASVDVMAAVLLERCAYGPDERDMIVLGHEMEVEGGGRRRRRFSTLVAYGSAGGDTAMARTVSLPAAIAARRILDGSIAERGVLAPVVPEVYDPLLDELATMGIACEERES